MTDSVILGLVSFKSIDVCAMVDSPLEFLALKYTVF